MGSVFQLRDFWAETFPGEEFSPSAVAVGDLDNLDTVDKIAIGSFQGVLRLFLPSSNREDSHAADVLYEQKFDEPILQLACGRFQPVSADVSRNLLAILFPRKLMFLLVERFGDHGDRSARRRGSDAGDEMKVMDVYYKCEPVFETHFSHTVYNMTYGPFGRANRDMVCVQSMDGQLSVVDHNKVICERFLPSNQFLIPGCLAYCWQRDTFLTNNSSMFLMCYEFSNIANSLGSERKDKRDAETGEDAAIIASGGSTGSRIAPAWTFNLGDDAVDIKTCRLSRGLNHNEGNVVVLCPYSLYVLSLDGVCLFSKRLDVETCSLCVYPIPDINADNLLVGAFNGSLYVYSDVALEWSAVMKSGCPLHLSVSTLCGTQGMVLALNSEGTLSVNYLGTDPADAPLQPLDSKTATYTDMNRELRVVQQSIRRLLDEAEDDGISQTRSEGASQGTSPAVSPTSADPLSGLTQPLPGGAKPSLAVPTSPGATADAASPRQTHSQTNEQHHRQSDSATPPTACDPSVLSLSFGETEIGDAGEVVLPLRVHFNRPCQELQTLVDVVVEVNAVAPVAVEPAHKVLPRISVGESLTVPLRVTAAPDRDQIVPSSLEVTAVVVFTGRRYDTWAYRSSALAPLSLVARPVPPVKNTAFSLQLNTNKSPPPSLMDLFSDLASYGNVTANVLSINYLNGADATILVSKNAARFKLQGSTMEGLWLLSSELVRRLCAHYEDEGDLVFSIPDAVPLEDFAAIVDTHAAIRKELLNATAALDRAAQFFRSVQRRLLVRFRDRTPNNSETMTALFEQSYAQLQKAADGVGLAKARQRQACAMLNCCARLLFFWMRTKFPSSFEKMTSVKQKEGKRRSSVPAVTQTTIEDLLKELFTCDISADEGVGWEEVAEAALIQLLEVKARTTVSKSLEVSLNTANLKKYIVQLVEHIETGKGF